MTDLRPNSEIADGIHWIEHGFVNSYIVEDKEHDELILIDTAMNKKAKKIIEYIRSELNDQIPAKVYLTHHHLDHMGGARKLQDEFHPRFFAHEHDADVISGDRTSLVGPTILKPLIWVVMKLIGPKPVTEPIEFVEDGQKSDMFKVFHLPGHTMGSVGFLQNATMFSGDSAVTDSGNVKLGPKTAAEDWDLAHHSMKKLGTIGKFEQILPGHGEPILEDAHLRVKDKIEELDL